MRNTVLAACAVAALLVAGCQKTDLAPTATPQAPRPGAVNSAPATSCDVISFENASGLLSQVTSAGGTGPITMVSHNDNYPAELVAAMIFESSSTTPPREGSLSYGSYDPFQEAAEDLDLGTPNETFPGFGYGRGAAGEISNSVALGNILIVQNFLWPAPNDDDGTGYITFNFSAIGPITPASITVIDAEYAEQEGGTVELWATDPALGGTPLASIPLPNTGSNGVAVLNLGNQTGVQYIRLNIDGSIGFDNLAFCRPQALHCNYTQGYWKNHPASWPVSSLTIGTLATPYSKTDLLKVLTTPVKGNGLLALAHQLIAAKLNVALDGDPAIATTIAQADALIGSRSLFGGTLKPSETSALVATLDAYNNSNHCN